MIKDANWKSKVPNVVIPNTLENRGKEGRVKPLNGEIADPHSGEVCQGTGGDARSAEPRDPIEYPKQRKRKRGKQV